MTGADIENLHLRIAELEQQVTTLRRQVISLKFSLENIADNEKKVVFYTGFLSFASLKVRFEFLGPAVDHLIYWNCKST